MSSTTTHSWKANIDVQFVSESSLALAHHVSGYVTKSRGVAFKRFGTRLVRVRACTVAFRVRNLYSRECGLYEASDLLLGDHLTKKSDTVKWVDVSEEQARSGPDTDNIYEESAGNSGWQTFVSTTLWPSTTGKLNTRMAKENILC